MRRSKVAAVTLAACATMAGCGDSSGTTGKVTSGGAAPIKVALLTSITGVAASEYHDTPSGFLARIAQQNAEGGVNGHMLVPIVINDQGSITAAQTGVQEAVSKGAFGVVAVSPFTFAAYKPLVQQHIPVTGTSSDGPEWGEQPDTNMFASDTGSVDPSYPANTTPGLFYKAHGGTSIATYGYSVTPASRHSAEATATSAVRAGLKKTIVDTSLPFGGVDFTTAALQAKQAGVDTVYAALDNISNFALLTAFQQAGVHLKVVNFPTGIQPDIVQSPAWASVQGTYFTDSFHPTQLPSAATQAFQAALLKYEHVPTSNFPTYNVYEGWLGADLFIKGLQVAGKNPQRTSFITNLRKVTSYDGGGLLPQPINYATIFGHDAPKTCDYFLEAQPSGFVPVGTGPICGPDIPGSATASS